MSSDGLSADEARLVAALEDLALEDDDDAAAGVALSLRRRLPNANVAMVGALLADTASMLVTRARDGADCLGLIEQLVNACALRLDGITAATTAPAPGAALNTPATVDAHG